METSNMKSRLIGVVRLSTEYCSALQSAREMERGEFIDVVLGLLPRLYFEFFDIEADDMSVFGEGGYYSSYVDEDYYDSIRRNIETLLGPDDVFLETFEEDMKYSDTPIAASVSESLADIFQPLYNFVSSVKDTDGDSLEESFLACKEDFNEYWSQTLCNVMRALNNLKYKGNAEE